MDYTRRFWGATVLAQIYTSLDIPNKYKLYISMDEVKSVLGNKVRLLDILNVYEEILGKVFENLNTPVYLLIDEIHYEKDWAIILKSIYERSNKVFILCTGSSALSLQTNADTSRRSYFDKVFKLVISLDVITYNI